MITGRQQARNRPTARLQHAMGTPVIPENPNPFHFLNFSAAGLNLRALWILFAGVVERDETGRGVSACFDLDLASVQAIHEKGDRRPAPPAWRLPEGSMSTSDQPGRPTVVVLDLPALARLARVPGLRPAKYGHSLATSAIS